MIFADFFYLWVAGTRLFVVRDSFFRSLFLKFLASGFAITPPQKTSKIASEKTRHSFAAINKVIQVLLAVLFNISRYRKVYTSFCPHKVLKKKRIKFRYVFSV